MSLSRESILSANDVITERVDVPEWGNAVLVRGMTGRERDQFEASIRQIRPTRDGRGQEVALVQDYARPCS